MKQTRVDDVPGTGRPLHRALAKAGYRHLGDLDGVPRTVLLNLHGVGKVGLARLEQAMAERGYGLAGGHAVVTSTDRGAPKPAGRNRSSPATAPTEVSPYAFVESLPEARRVVAGRELLSLFADVTGAEPRMWGPSMVGYGELHYQYATGRQGDMMRVGFSPGKARISLYGLHMYGSNADLVDQLGKVRLGKSCIYVNKLADVDVEVLRALIARVWNDPDPKASGVHSSADESAG